MQACSEPLLIKTPHLFLVLRATYISDSSDKALCLSRVHGSKRPQVDVLVGGLQIRVVLRSLCSDL